MHVQPRVVVVGGGFAGVEAVRTLTRSLPKAQVTLIDAHEYATMLPALPDVLSGRVRRSAITVPFRNLFDSRIRCIAGRVIRLELESRLVHTEHEALPYDYLILANGSTPAFYGFEPEEGALHTVDSFPAADALRSALESELSNKDRCTLLVVGGGYTGLEVAACAREGFSGAGDRLRVLVVERADEILSGMTQRVKRRVQSYLDRSGVSVVTGTSLEALKGDTAVFSDGTTIHDAVVCWSAGMQAATPETSVAVPAARDKRVHTDETLALPGYPEVFVAGDASLIMDGDRPVRRAVNFAFYSGRRAAKNVAARVHGRALRPFKPVDLGWVIPLGGTSSGTVFGFIPVAGRFGLRLHYLMSGFRHFSFRAAFEFYRTAFHLGRSVDSPRVCGDNDTGGET